MAAEKVRSRVADLDRPRHILYIFRYRVSHGSISFPIAALVAAWVRVVAPSLIRALSR